MNIDKIRREFDKINTDDFCAWLLHYHTDLFKKLHKEYLKDSIFSPDERKEFMVDFDMIKKELNKIKDVI